MKFLGTIKIMSKIAAIQLVLLGFAGLAAAAGGGSVNSNILIETDNNNYAAITSVIEGAGGSVTHTFKYVNGLSANVPASAMAQLSGMVGVKSVTLDAMQHPGPVSGYEFEAAGNASLDDRGSAEMAANKVSVLGGSHQAQSVSAQDLDTYFSYVPESMNTGAVFNGGNLGQGSLVVIIDSGTYADHVMFGGRVIGGVDLSTDVGGPDEGATHGRNFFHGTHVGGIVAGAAIYTFDENWIFIDAIERYSGYTLNSTIPGTKDLLLLGTAPAAELYAVKVFPAGGGGASTSTIIAGIEHAIDMHVNGPYDVDVINMSLGGGTGFEGRDLESQAVDAATAAGITVVVSAGNDGPASQTIGSPAGAHTAITVGAVSHPVNTRAFWDFNYNFPGVGDLLTVDDNPQMVYFSSRGNTGDGRDEPTASAVGVFVLSASSGTENPFELSFSSGTSMSSPAMAGIVALLNTHSEANELGASPFDYKQAVVAGSNMLPGYEAYEQGAGFIDAGDALNAFIADSDYGSAHPAIKNGHTRHSRKPEGRSIQGANGNKGVTIQLKDLKPGYVEDFFFDLQPNAERIVVEFSDVDYGVDPLGFNSFEFHLMSGMRSTDGGYYFATTNVWGDATFTVESQDSQASGQIFGVNAQDLTLMPGHVRMSIENDWTSYDNMSGTVTVRVEHGNNSDKPDESYSGSFINHEDSGFFPVGWGDNGVEISLDWKNNWSAYPSSDMDMIVAWWDTDGGFHWEFGGATLSSPEAVMIDANNIDYILVLVDAFETFDQTEPWTLNVNYK